MSSDLRSQRLRCCCTVASGPVWENRPCGLPATRGSNGRFYCHVHAPRSAERTGSLPPCGCGDQGSVWRGDTLREWLCDRCAASKEARNDQ